MSVLDSEGVIAKQATHLTTVSYGLAGVTLAAAAFWNLRLADPVVIPIDWLITAALLTVSGAALFAAAVRTIQGVTA